MPFVKRLTTLPAIAIALSLGAAAPDTVARTESAFDPAAPFGADEMCGTDPASANAPAGISGAMPFMDDPDPDGPGTSPAAPPTTEMGRLYALVDLADVTIRSNGDGPWSDPASWFPARVPVAGDRVHVRAGETITLDGERDAPLRTLRLDGTLRFATDRDTRLVVDTLVSGPRSALLMGTELDPVEAEHTARLVIADHDDPAVAGDEGFERGDPTSKDYDPAMLGLGVVTHGRFESAGAPRAHGGALADPPLAGDATLRLDFEPFGWRAGDEIVVAGTARDALGDEKRRVASVDAASRTVILDAPLALDHAVPRHTKAGLELAVHVINLTRNVVVETVDAGTGPSATDHTYRVDALDRDYTIDLFHERGHVMFMHADDVTVRHTRFRALGRTNKHGAIDDVTFDASGALVHAGVNPRARYPLHFHRTGLDGTPALVTGSVADDSPGWCFVNHGGHADFVANVAHDCDGAGFASERGDELGSFVDNISIRNTADEGKNSVQLRFQARKPINDFGFGGHGFWLQGINVDVRDNVASGAGREAFALYPLLFDGADETRVDLDDIPMPQRAAFGTEPTPERVPVHTFDGNVAYGSNIGLMIGEHRTDVPSRLARFTGWMLRMGTTFNYSDAIRFEDLTLIGNLDTPEGLGAFAHHGTSNVTMERVHVEGFALGLQVPRAGNQAVDTHRFKYAAITDAYLDNVLNLHVVHTRNHDFLHADIVRPTFGTLGDDALAHGLAALGRLSTTPDLDIDSSNLRSNGLRELAAEVAGDVRDPDTDEILRPKITGQIDYYLHYTQTAHETVDSRHQRDGFLPKVLNVVGRDGRRHRLFFEREQSRGFVPFPTKLYEENEHYDLSAPLDPNAPNGNRNSNLPAEFLDARIEDIAELFQRRADDPRWADFAASDDRRQPTDRVDAAADYPGFALVPGGRMLPDDNESDPRFERWARTRNVVAMRVDDLPDVAAHVGTTPLDDTPDGRGPLALEPIRLDADACTGLAPCLDGLTALSPAAARIASDAANGKSLFLDGVFDAFEHDAPFSLAHKSFTWSANLRPLDVERGTVVDAGDGASGYRIGFRDGRLVAALTVRGETVELAADPAPGEPGAAAPLVAGNWLHAALTVNHGLGQAILYVNGARVASAVLDPFRTSGGDTFSLGTTRRDGGGDADRYRGFVDDLVVSALTYTDPAARDLAARSAKPAPVRRALDSDADGIADVDDATPLDAANGLDADGDRLADDVDDDAGTPFTDADGDGVPDARDAFPADRLDWHDADGDGNGDNRDEDIDGDGVANAADAFPRDGNESTDADGDGVGDRADRFPDDPDASGDADGDGVADALDALPFAASASADADGDGIGDADDIAPADPAFGREPNLVGNGDFESGSSGWDDDASNGQVVRDPDVGHRSAASLKLVGESGDGGILLWLTEFLPVEAATERLRFEAWIRTENSDDSDLRLAIDYRDDGGVLRRAYRKIDVDDGTADWRLHARSVSVPSGIESVQVRLKTSATPGSTAWFDDVALYAGTPVDSDDDGVIDRLDPDDDGDGFLDGEDPAPLDPLVGPDVDRDGDGVPDAADNCPPYANGDQRDTDADGAGDACDVDDDGDGHPDALDRFPRDAGEHADLDGDGLGDAADPDDDGDGLPDALELALGLDPRAGGDGAKDLDRDGTSNLDEYRSGTALDVDDVAPELSAPSDLVLVASGPTTAVDLGVATARDARDGTLIATPSPLGPYPSGRHAIRWRVADDAGNVAEDAQTLTILPRLFVTGPTVGVEGGRVELVVALDGEAPDYPVAVPYAFAGSADALDFSVDGRAGGGEGVLLIGERRRAIVAIETHADASREGDDTIELVLGTPVGAALGDDGVHRVTFREANVAPRVTLSVTQGGVPVARLLRDGAPARVTAEIVDPNSGDAHALDWSASDPAVLADALVDGTTLVVDPAALVAGAHDVVLRVGDDGDGQLEGEARTTLVVVERAPDAVPDTAPAIGAAIDVDPVPSPTPGGDAVPIDGPGADAHPELDADGDRIPDANDVVPEPWLMTTGDGGAALQTAPGHRLALGVTALAAGRDGARLDGGETGAATFDVEVHDIAVGGIARLVLPLVGGIPDGARVRVTDGPGRWRDFSTSPDDTVASARGASETCPGVDDAGYAIGLGNGDHCLRLALVDGGANDADGRADGVVRLTVAVVVDALPVPAVVVAPEPLPEGTRFTERGERVVLAFALRTDHVDAELDGLTLEARGTLDVARDVRAVTLYADANDNGVPEAVERLASGTYAPGDARLDFRFDAPHALAVGDSAFLVTYRF